jgi:4-diphosphocytidyl-2-C-methyl-D-erythritol kinase
LAGGSTDAAAALLGLNRLWGLDLTRDALAALGAELGSDVPFFFHTPAAWCTGRGERVEPMPVGGPLDLVLVCPAFGMPTAAVYRQVTVPEAPVPGEPIRAALAAGDAAAVGRLLHNRLQPAAEALDPRLAGYASRLAALGPAGRLMSGSGSTLFAVCGSPADARRVADALGPTAAAEGFSILTARTCA